MLAGSQHACKMLSAWARWALFNPWMELSAGEVVESLSNCIFHSSALVYLRKWLDSVLFCKCYERYLLSDIAFTVRGKVNWGHWTIWSVYLLLKKTPRPVKQGHTNKLFSRSRKYLTSLSWLVFLWVSLKCLVLTVLSQMIHKPFDTGNWNG